MRSKHVLFKIRKNFTMFENWIILVIICLTVFTPLTTKSQVANLPENATFYDYLNAFYNSDRYNPEDETEGGQKVAHERLSQIWGKRLYPHGDFSIANRAIIDYAQSFTPFDNRSENPNWVCIGPSNGPANSSSNGVGQIHRITFDPGYGMSNQTIYACTGFGGLWRTENDGGLWEVVNTDALPITSVADVVVNPNNNKEIIIATGVADDGVELAYSPNWANTNPIYTIGMYRSIDYGTSWHEINNGFLQEFYNNGGTVRKLEIDQNDPDIVFAATSNGVFRTTNAFDPNPVWEKVFSGPSGNNMDFRSVKFKPGSSSTLYVSAQDIFKSTDGGDTWSTMTGSNTGLDFSALLPFEPYRINIAVTPANDNRLFAYIWGPNPGSDNSEAYIYYCDNGIWNQLSHKIGYNAKEWIALAASPKNADEYYFYWYGVYGRENLEDPPVAHAGYIGNGYYADGHVLEYPPYYPPTDPLIFYGHHAGFSVGDLNGAGSSWEYRNTGLQNMLHWSFDDSEFEKDIILTANQDCFHYYKKDGEWRIVPGVIGDSYSARSSGVNRDLFFLSKGDNILWSFNMSTGLKSSESHKRPYDGYAPNNLCHIPKTFSLKTFPNDNSDYFSFSEIYKRIYDWPDGHTSNDLWDIDSDIGKYEPQMWKRQITEMDFCYADPNYIYIATGGVSPDLNGNPLVPQMYKTTYGGNNGDYSDTLGYVPITYPGMGNNIYPIISGIAVHPTDPNRVWITLIGYDNIDIRVAYSTTGGIVWEDADPSNSLPRLPINNIVYQYGSDDVLYIATDAGIYYKDATMENWEEYGEFPHVRVMELDINYCQNKLRAATYGRTMWEGDLLPTVNEVYYTISSDESIIWEKSMSLSTGLIIESGAELTIKGIVNVPKDSKIIVKQGGKLIIDGGTLKNGCGQPWQGIQIWGDKTAHQYPDANGNYQQGYLKLINGATIENAIIAIDLWKPNDWSSTGGIVYADEAIFRNNAKSVHALHYRNFNPYNPQQELDYFSNFKICTFEITEDYLGYETFYKHVDLAHVKGINFYACDFSVNDQVEDVSIWNSAIAGYDAQFGVKAICKSQHVPCLDEDYDRCTFSGFYSAISAVNDGSVLLSFNISRADFIDNAYGVKTRKMNNASVLFSDFEIGHLWDCGAGIYSDNGTGFAFEENSFSKYPGDPALDYFGIIIYNSEAVNEVYKNTFNGLSYANFSDGKNWVGDDRYQGLSYLCNQNSNNYADFYVNDYATDKHSGIQSFQGSGSNPAGNTFTQNGATWHFYNGGEHLVGYYYNQNENDETPDDDKIYHVIKVGKNITNTCPSHYGGASTRELVLTALQKAAAEQDYYTNLIDYNNVKTLYDSYIDGGDTEAEILDIQRAQPDNMWELRAKLLGYSPHLSFDVLKEVADKTDVFPESALFDILAANPDELKKDTLISYLENKEEPLPEYMVNLLKQLAEGTTYKTALQQQMAGYKHAYTRAAHDIIRSLLNDTITDNVELRNWLDNLGGITSDRQIISSYISEGNFTNAYALANMLPQLYKLKDNELTEHYYYMDMLNLHHALYQQGRNTFQLDSTEKADIIFIANNSTGVAGAQAKSILEAVYNEYYDACPKVDGTAGYKSSSIINPNELGKAHGLNISVKPNPAKQWAAFYYTLPEDKSKATITITNATGSTIETLEVSEQHGQKLWDTRKVKPGTYIYTIRTDGYSQSGKIVISK
ncbi:MAG: T9SS type A sorting domain-containing protein [Bacteroidales bacterium]|nr:T9SS type A sorting domain-containing protein [Bacteroidales bacterium]MDD3700859.1 T9SS type A sorting domain-containing protein [Bacteroidales bacterium]MDY0369844.1 T9SS type A sorting domain-containing protein [Bacteroidales bacterium]